MDSVTFDPTNELHEGGRQPGLVLTFARGDRPQREAVAAAIAKLSNVVISHDPTSLAGRPRHVAHPQQPRRGRHEAQWLELLLDGLTFDLVGLAPGPSIAAPEVAHRYNCEIDPPGEAEAIGLFAGPHIARGIRSLPILRTLLGLGAGLAESLAGVKTVCWTPARSAIAPRFYIRSVRSWLEGGPFPALGLLGLSFDDEGGLRSEGLQFLTGRELVIDPSLTGNRAAAMRLAVRIVHELVGTEMSASEHAITSETGDVLILTREADTAIFAVRPG